MSLLPSRLPVGGSDVFGRAVDAGEPTARPVVLASVSELWTPPDTDEAYPDAVLPPELVHGIEAAVAGVMSPQVRAAALSRMVEEMHQTLAWMIGGGPGQAELDSFTQVLAAAYAHEDRVVALRTAKVRR